MIYIYIPMIDSDDISIHHEESQVFAGRAVVAPEGRAVGAREVGFESVGFGGDWMQLVTLQWSVWLKTRCFMVDVT